VPAPPEELPPGLVPAAPPPAEPDPEPPPDPEELPEDDPLPEEEPPEEFAEDDAFAPVVVVDVEVEFVVGVGDWALAAVPVGTVSGGAPVVSLDAELPPPHAPSTSASRKASTRPVTVRRIWR